MKRDDILTIGGVALGAVGAYLLGRSTAVKAAKDDIEEKAEELKELDPTLTDPEAAAVAAAAAAAAALLAAQQAAAKARLDELASELARKERELAAAEQLAILQATLAAAKTAEAARVAAEEARAKQQIGLENALNLVYADLVVAQASVIVADKNYAIQRDNVNKLEAEITRLEGRISSVKSEIASNKGKILSLEAEIREYGAWIWIWQRDELEALRNQIAKLTFQNISNLQPLLDSYQAQLVTTKNELVSAIRIESNIANKAQDTINACNLIIERAETLTGEARLLRILVTLAGRVDGLARTVQIKLRELEAKIEG